MKPVQKTSRNAAEGIQFTEAKFRRSVVRWESLDPSRTISCLGKQQDQEYVNHGGKLSGFIWVLMEGGTLLTS